MSDKEPVVELGDFATVVQAVDTHLYSNAFQIGIGVADITVLLSLNGKPNGVLNLSFTTAKTLSVMLAQSIASIEATTGQEIMTTQRIEEALKANSGVPVMQ